MKYLDLTFADPARNLACDEALLDICESDNAGEVLRTWQPPTYFVVVGYSNSMLSEVDVPACAAREIPILRRFSGGGAVLQGPGCLNYTLVVNNERQGSFSDIGRSYRRVLDRHRRVFETLLSLPVQIEGTSDLTITGRKFSGNAQHRKHCYTMFHGTFLLNFDLSVVERCLPLPSRQPGYRRGRPHEAFLTNVFLDAARVCRALKEAWQADCPCESVPQESTEALVGKRYSRRGWNYKF